MPVRIRHPSSPQFRGVATTVFAVAISLFLSCGPAIMRAQQHIRTDVASTLASQESQQFGNYRFDEEQAFRSYEAADIAAEQAAAAATADASLPVFSLGPTDATTELFSLQATPLQAVQFYLVGYPVTGFTWKVADRSSTLVVSPITQVPVPTRLFNTPLVSDTPSSAANNGALFGFQSILSGRANATLVLTYSDADNRREAARKTIYYTV